MDENIVIANENITLRNNTISGSHFKGFLGSLAFGIIATIPWIVVYCLGYYVGYLAFLIGLAAGFGYQKLGGKTSSKASYFIITLSFIISFIIGLFVSYCISIYLYADIPDMIILDTPFILIDNLLYNPEIQDIIIDETLKSSLFGLIGLVMYLFYYYKKNKAAKTQAPRVIKTT